MIVDWETCIGCGLCVEVCPLGAISLAPEKKASISDICVDCQACTKVCPREAITLAPQPKEGGVRCLSCPSSCYIKVGKTGACQRFVNWDGELSRNIPLQRYNDVKEIVGEDHEEAIRRPLITGIGAGTTYPDTKPAPYIVQSRLNGIDVVTVVTEAPLSYSGIKVKVDTDLHMGDEGSPVLLGKKKVGHLCTEEYGSKILSLGGVNLLTGKDGTEIDAKRPTYLISIDSATGMGGVATSGLGGRSFTKGIASATTILSETASLSDAAATVIGNFTNVEDADIAMSLAEEIYPDTDLVGEWVTTSVGKLSQEEIEEALNNGLSKAYSICQKGLIHGALVALRGKVVWTDSLNPWLTKL